MGVGNFFGMLPESMKNSRLYGVELDSITGRIAKQLYPKADITVAGFETTDRKDFYDLAVGNVPFGQYQVSDRAFDKLGFSIHNYFRQGAGSGASGRRGGLRHLPLHHGRQGQRRKEVYRPARGLPRRDPPAQQCVPRQRRYGCRFGYYLSSKAGQTH